MKQRQILTVAIISTIATLSYAQCPELAPEQLIDVITNKVSTSTGKTLTFSEIRPKEPPIPPLIMNSKFIHSLVFDNDLYCTYDIVDNNGNNFRVVITLKVN